MLLSLPSVERLLAGNFNLEDLVNKLTEALDDEYHRNEILSLTEDSAVLVIECLDKVSESGSGSCMPSPYYAVDHLFSALQSQGYPHTFKGFLNNFEALPLVPISPLFVLDRRKDSGTSRRGPYIWDMRPGVPRKAGWRGCSGEGSEDIEKGRPGETQEGKRGERSTWTLAGLMTRVALLQGGHRMETRLVSIHPQIRWCVLQRWRSGHRHTLDP